MKMHTIQIYNNSPFEEAVQLEIFQQSLAALPLGYRFCPTQSLDAERPPHRGGLARLYVLVRRPRLANLPGKVSKQSCTISCLSARNVATGEPERRKGDFKGQGLGWTGLGYSPKGNDLWILIAGATCVPFDFPDARYGGVIAQRWLVACGCRYSESTVIAGQITPC